VNVAVAASWRWAVHLALWFALIGVPAVDSSEDAFFLRFAPDFAVGAVAAAIATWVSLRLLPPRRRRRSIVALGTLALRVLRQSFMGGVDVARRAFDPRLPLRPGFVPITVRLDDDLDAAVFASLTSLVPGTLPVDDSRKARGRREIVYHCLDAEAPVARELERDETLLAAALGAARTTEDART